MRGPWWWWRGASAAVAALVLGLIAAAAAANVFVEDRREQRDGRLPMFRSVGVLVHPRTGGGGTAFLVSRCHVVTAYHVAFMKRRDPITGRVETFPGKVGHATEFVIGPLPEAPGAFGARAHATVVGFGRFSDGSFEGMAGDWAILRLDKCLGREFGFLKYARSAGDRPLPTGALMTIGFPRSRSGQRGVTVETGCSARDHGPVDGLLGVDCAFEVGMSGGPVLERQADGGWLVVGLIQQSMGVTDRVLPAYSMAHRNQVVRVTTFGNALERALRAEGRQVLAKPR